MGKYVPHYFVYTLYAILKCQCNGFVTIYTYVCTQNNERSRGGTLCKFNLCKIMRLYARSCVCKFRWRAHGAFSHTFSFGSHTHKQM